MAYGGSLEAPELVSSHQKASAERELPQKALE